MIERIVKYYLKKTGQVYDPKEDDKFTNSIKELQELTERLHKKDKKIQRHTEMTNAENEILRMLSRGETTEDIFQKIVGNIEYFLPNSYGSILLNYDGVLWDRYSPNVPKEYINTLSNGFPIGSDHGSCGTAAYCKKPVKCEDISTDPKWTKFPEVLEKAYNNGIRSCYSMPIIDSNNETLGTIAIYGTEEIDQEFSYRILCWSTKVATLVLDRDKTLEELQYKNDQLENIMNSQIDLLVYIDNNNNNITYANNSYLLTFGLTEEDIKNGYDIAQLIHPDDLEDGRYHWEKIKEPPYRTRHKQRAYTVDGLRWFEWEAWTLFDPKGNQIGMCGSGRDITQRIQAEYDLQEHKQLLEDTFNSILDGIVVLDKDQNIIQVNHKVEEWYGPKENILGKKCYNIFQAGQKPCSDCATKRVLTNKDASTTIKKVIDQHGDERIHEVNAYPLTKNGEIVGVIEYVRDITEKEYLKYELDEKSTYLESILNLQSFCITRLNTNFEIIYANEAEIDTFFNNNDYFGVNIIEHHVHPDYHQYLYDKAENLYNGKNIHGDDIKVLDKYNNIRWHRCFATSIVKNDIVCEIQVVSYDVTDEVIASEKINQLVRENESLLHNIDTLVWYMTDEKTQGSANQAFLDFFGYEKSNDVKGKSLYELMTEDEAEFCISTNKEVFEKNTTIRTKEWVTNCNGEQRLLLITKNLVINENERYIVCSATDITEKEEAEKALTQSEEKYKLLVNQSQTMIFSLDINGNITYVSPSIYNLTGFQTDEVVGHNIQEFIHKEDIVGFHQYLEGIKGLSFTRGFEYRVYHKNGALRWHKTVLTPLSDHETDAFIGNTIDITTQKNAEEKLGQAFSENLRKTQILEAILESSGGFLWYKDNQNRYLFCDNKFAKRFHQLNTGADSYLKNDVELITNCRDKGHRHDFGELCLGTDEHSQKMQVQSRYIEGGIIDDKLVVLEVIKTPLFDKNDEYAGNVGFAWDRSEEIELLKKDLDILKKKGRLEVLSKKEYPDSPFVYHIKPVKKHKKTYIYKSLSDDATFFERRKIIR